MNKGSCWLRRLNPIDFVICFYHRKDRNILRLRNWFNLMKNWFLENFFNRLIIFDKKCNDFEWFLKIYVTEVIISGKCNSIILKGMMDNLCTKLWLLFDQNWICLWLLWIVNSVYVCNAFSGLWWPSGITVIMSRHELIAWYTTKTFPTIILSPIITAALFCIFCAKEASSNFVQLHLP